MYFATVYYVHTMNVRYISYLLRIYTALGVLCGYSHKCAGSIIRPKYVLTTARCIKHDVPSNLQVFVGSIHLHYGGAIFRAVQLITHQYFDNSTLADNVGLIKTVGSMLTAPKTRVVPLPNDFTYPGEPCIFYSWNMSNGSPPFSATLRYVNKSVMSLADCQSRWSVNIVTIQNLCTDYAAGGCTLGEGAPLVKNGSLVGMFSLGGTCVGGKPDVYVDIKSYVIWINSVATD
ncbi:chymotrypsin-2-like [Photinus pyralis]|uniref:chymotrypsin-2-like n=1 Tax=Photinus pyralis TaxID=7054 RepID=UPI001266F8FC|nr:chymotrypsin-2-like [Photinus pyralis]